MSTQSTALRKRGAQAPGSGTTVGSGRKLGARRLQTSRTSPATRATARAVPGGEPPRGRAVIAIAGPATVGRRLGRGTDSATKTLEGVTKLVTEDGKPDLHGRGNGTIVHNGTVISSSRSFNKATSVSRDTCPWSQGFKAFGRSPRPPTASPAIEETIDDGQGLPVLRAAGRLLPVETRAARAPAFPRALQSRPERATRLGGISPQGTFVALHSRPAHPPKPKETMDKRRSDLRRGRRRGQDGLDLRRGPPRPAGTGPWATSRPAASAAGPVVVPGAAAPPREKEIPQAAHRP